MSSRLYFPFLCDVYVRSCVCVCARERVRMMYGDITVYYYYIAQRIILRTGRSAGVRMFLCVQFHRYTTPLRTIHSSYFAERERERETHEKWHFHQPSSIFQYPTAAYNFDHHFLFVFLILSTEKCHLMAGYI
jgi:hypothetical protein